MNEESTKYHLIDPVLRTKGYDQPWKIKLETPPPVEPSGFKGKRSQSPGRTDYLIYVQPTGQPRPLPVGVLEAKAESEPPMKGMQQAKGYADCARYAVQYVFATNGHLYGEFDMGTQLPSGPHRMAEFPHHEALTERYSRDKGFDVTAPSASLLFQPDAAAWSKPRYYQDAAIRAAFEKVLQCEQRGEPARVLLSLATGAGKTVIAANLLWRLHEAGRLTKPALFLCDRDELRSQAMDKIAKAFPAGAVREVKTVQGRNAAHNAKVHIATYQVLGLDDEDQGRDSFLSRHYPEDAFSVIIIDECHRSAWGRWSEVLRRNPGALHIGLTATPRQLRAGSSKADDEISANNLTYFGEPVYEYTLVEAQEDGYLAACEIVRLKPSIDWREFTRDEVAAMRPRDARTGRYLLPDELKARYAAEDFDHHLMLPERINAMCDDLFQRLCRHGGPEQKLIIFCTRDDHADRVAQRLQHNYVLWCRANDRAPKDHYAFKCTDAGGRELLTSLRGSRERCFVACTVDLLATGVDIERLNAVVFFRYLSSSILFYQMVGRGTRIHEPTRKYKFWLYDYTGVTQLFGTDFITAPPRPRKTGEDDDDDGGGGDTGGDDDGGDDDDDPTPLPEARTGRPVGIEGGSRAIVQRREGRDVVVPMEEYRQGMIERVLREATTLNDFRALWVRAQTRQRLIRHLQGEHYDPARLREALALDACDDFDLFAHLGYRAAALTRPERTQAYLQRHRPWFDAQPPATAIVLRGLGHQFAVDGTEALDRAALWEVPEIRRAGGLDALRALGRPADVLNDAKLRLFGE
ncbi:DEAD/DEAH box helicase family protein [Ideonella sp. 4Y11]|uniref:DEAD/DEAH box helicase family protein n=1 Tax=Ideonella aquatica TaxID=2824119 RepID=A0A940YSE4_9BURK|nr:DEAD/DEAH box helicase family protein [Ideonella aquatica]MBQ0961058.1 DEAD/DEAH box helicase family protein [Ideonella aquatica]